MKMLATLEAIIADRRNQPSEASYTRRLMDSGTPKIAQKVGEEAVEVVIAALAQQRSDQVNELADLFFHTLVLMNQLGLTLDDVESELIRRHSPNPQETPHE